MQNYYASETFAGAGDTMGTVEYLEYHTPHESTHFFEDLYDPNDSMPHLTDLGTHMDMSDDIEEFYNQNDDQARKRAVADIFNIDPHTPSLHVVSVSPKTVVARFDLDDTDVIDSVRKYQLQQRDNAKAMASICGVQNDDPNMKHYAAWWGDNLLSQMSTYLADQCDKDRIRDALQNLDRDTVQSFYDSTMDAVGAMELVVNTNAYDKTAADIESHKMSMLAAVSNGLVVGAVCICTASGGNYDGLTCLLQGIHTSVAYAAARMVSQTLRTVTLADESITKVLVPAAMTTAEYWGGSRIAVVPLRVMKSILQTKYGFKSVYENFEGDFAKLIFGTHGTPPVNEAWNQMQNWVYKEITRDSM